MSRTIDLTLVRVAYLPQATIGRLLLPGVPFALWTIERPWIPNLEAPATAVYGGGGTPRVSCVPDGLYRLTPHASERHPGTFQLVNEGNFVYRDTLPAGQSWGRTGILIHAANQADELEGCIAPGSQVVIYDNRPTLLMSSAAMDTVRSAMSDGVPASIFIRPSSGTREPTYLSPPKSSLPRVIAPVTA